MLTVAYFEKYKRYHTKLLSSLKSTQKLKLEEIKRKTLYYQVKDLVDRYDDHGKAIQTKESPTAKSVENRLVKTPSKTPTNIDANVRPSINSQYNASAGSVEGAPRLYKKRSAINFVANELPVLKVVYKRSWIDRLVNAILGEDPVPVGDFPLKSASSLDHLKSSSFPSCLPLYALICGNCRGHNGLVPREQYFSLIYICPKCHHWNGGPKTNEAQEVKEKEPIPDLGKPFGDNLPTDKTSMENVAAQAPLEEIPDKKSESLTPNEDILSKEIDEHSPKRSEKIVQKEEILSKKNHRKPHKNKK